MIPSYLHILYTLPSTSSIQVLKSKEKVKMFGFFFSALKKVYHLFRKVLGNRQQSLPSTKQDLKDPRTYHLGQQLLPSTKQDLEDPEKYHLRQQSLPWTQQNLKDPQKYHHNAFSFSKINSPDSIPSAQNAPTTQRQTLPSPVYNQPKDTLPRVTLKVDSGINTRKTPYAPIETHSALPGSAKSPAVLNKPVLCHAAPGSTSHLTKSTYNIVEEGSTPLYEIPEDIKTLIKRDIVPPILKKPLSAQTYKDYFAALLYAEDYYLEVLQCLSII